LNASWRFFAALLAGFLLVFGATVTAFYFNLGVPSSSLSSWAFELNQKKRALATQASSPKLLLVGGSATLFGISAKEIQCETGFRAINLANHAALGPTYMLCEAQRAAKSGDTVLLVFEYELYDFGKVERVGADSLQVDYIVSRDPDFFYGLSPMEKWNVFMLTSNQRLLQALENRVRPEAPRDMGIYDVRYVNDWGDQMHHAEADRPAQSDPRVQSKSVLRYGLPKHPKAFPSIKSFCQWAQTRQIRVLATYPNLCDQPEYHFPTARQTAKTIHDSFAALNVPVIGDYTDALLPAEQFFDTNYHLTEEAAVARTRRLIPQLMPFLK
jgi:hypothetical protein